MKRRIVSVLTALALLLSLCPTWAFAVEGEPDTGLCDHHREHTGCGYAAPTEGQPCGHEHTDECYTEETLCVHAHDETCYSDGLLPNEGEEKAADACTHICSVESGCVTRTLDCQHSHDEECGYVQTDPGTPCGYECRICPIEALIDALPGKVTEENRADVEARLQEILALITELPEDQLELVDITPCLTLQVQLDAASAAAPLADEISLNSRITINSGNLNQYNDKVITGATTENHLTIDGVEVSLTIKDMSLLLNHSDTDTGLMHAGIALRNGATLHLTLKGTNTIKGGNGFAAISVPEGCTLEITSASTGSLEANGGSGGAGIGADWGRSMTSIQKLGSIEINGGNIVARGNRGAAGIGGTMNCMTGSITIKGGMVYAEGSSFEDNGATFGGAGIGGGYFGYVPMVNITGGTVTAKAGCNTAACIGAGTSGHFLTGDTIEYRCGAISITGGTVTTDGQIALGHSFDNATGSITLSTGATLNINNGAVRPMPADWNSYSMNGRVFDTSITGGQIAAGLLIDGRTYDVTIIQDTSQPYCGKFSLKILLPETSSIEVGLLLNGKTVTETVSLSDTTVNVTFGTQNFQNYSITGTIYDGRITGDMEATVAFLGETHTVTLTKTSDYCATFRIDNLVAAAADVARELPVTVTAGEITWSGTSSSGAQKTLAIGQQMYKTRLIFWDGGITADMPVSQIQVSRGSNILSAIEMASDNTLHMTQLGKGYVDIWMVPGEDTSISVTVPGLNGGQAIQKTGITIESNDNEFEMYRGVSTDTPTLDVANGDVIFEEIDGSLSVTYQEGGEQKKSVGLSYDALHVVTQSNSTSAVANRIIVRNIEQPLYLQIQGVNLNREGQNSGSPISIEANCTVELQTKGSNTVVSNSTDPAVYVDPTATLTLSGDGELTANYTRNVKYFAAAIGGKYGESSGKIIIRSGRVVATRTISTSSGAGIGGGENGAGDVEIHGGIVEASAGDGAGIGGGKSGNGTVKIYGGTVTVSNDTEIYGAGIGGGQYGTGTVDIYGGNVNVTSTINKGAGIGGGESGSGTVRIYGGNVNVVSTKNMGAGIGGGLNSPGTVEISGGTVRAESSGSTAYGAAIGGGENANGNVTISGGKVSAVIEVSAAAIGGGRGSTLSDKGGGADITISGGVIDASAGYGPAIGSGGGSGVSSKNAVVTISGGTITTSYTQTSGSGDTNIQIGARSKGTATVTITGGSIRTQGENHISSPTNGSTAVSLTTITLPSGAVPADTPLTSAEGYRVHDVYPLDGNRFYFYLPANTLPARITAGGVDYVPEHEGSTNYVVDFQVSFNGYSLTKEYDGTPMQEPTASQVTSNGGNLTFAWYQGGTSVSEPVHAGSYTLRVSSDKGSKDFEVEITKRPLTITAQAQTIDYKGTISQTAYKVSGLAAGDKVGSISFATDKTAPGTYTGAITAGSAQIMRDGVEVTGNYTITYAPGDLTIRQLAYTVDGWPTADAITYGQTLSESNLKGGDTNGTFAWKGGTVKPSAGTAEFDVVFTPADTNYGTVTGKVSVTVQKAELTVKASNQTIAYGGSIQTGVGQVTAAALVNGDILNAVQVSASTSARDAGTYTGGITVTGAKIGNNGTDVTANYEISYEAGALTIIPLAITVTPNSGQSKEYGAADPVLTYTVTPALIGNDKLTGVLTYEGVETGATGQHKITLGTLSAGGNYTLALSGDVTFEITKPSLETAVVTLDETSFTYDGTAKAPIVTVKKGDAIVDAGEYDISYSNTNGGAGDNIHAGTVTVTVTAKESGNYSGSKDAEFIINPKKLTPAITGTTTKTYDGTTAAPAGLSITLEGKVGSDDVTATAASYAYNSLNVMGATKITATGITLNGDDAGNYQLTSDTATATGTITKADQTAPAAPTATDANIKDTSITLDTIENANYKMDNGEWQESPTFTGLDPNKAYTFYARLKADSNHNASLSSEGTSITTKKTMLNTAVVTVNGTYTYTGAAIVPEAGNVTVDLNGTTLNSSQYTISASNNINAGKATATLTVTATADGNYSGSASTTFTISPATLTIKANGQTITYGGSITQGTGQVIPTGLCTGDSLNSITLTASSDQVAAADKTIMPSAAQIQNGSNENVTANYSITYQPGALTINKSQPTINWAEGFGLDKTYDGQTIPNPVEANLTITGAKFSDVTFAWSATPKNAGSYTLTASIPVTDNTEATSTTLSVTIAPKTVTSPAIELSDSSFVYDGAEKKPAVVVKDGNTIIPASEYTVTYSGNVNAGTATVTITDNEGGNCTISGTKTFTITAKPLAGASVSATGPFTYTGSALTPDPVVTLGGQTLVKGTDYTVAYTNNTNAGTATITVTGKGNYSGTAQGAFTIGKATLTVDGTGTASGTYGAKLSALTVSGLTAKLGDTVVAGTWKLAGDTVPNVGDSGEYTATFTPDGGADNYNPLTAKVKLNIAKATYTGTKDAATSGKFGTTGTYDLSALLPDGATAGTAATTSDIFEGTPAVSGKSLSYQLKTDATVGSTGTITVPVTSTNYNDFDLTITVTVTDKDVPALTISPISITYNGEAVPSTAIKGTAKVGNTTVPGTWSFGENQALTNVADSGTKTVKFVPTDKNNYAEATGTVIVTISKATPTGAPKYTAISTSGKTLADAELTTEGSSLKPVGTVAWALAGTTEVTANTAYEWIFTPTDTANYTTLTGKITPWVRSTGGGTYVPSGPSTPGSSTLPVTTTGQGSSNVTTTTTAAPTASTQGGIATTTVNTTMGQEIVKQAVANKSEEVVIAPKVTGNVTKTEVSIPASTVGQIGSQTNASLTVSTPVADVTIPNGGLGSLSSAGGAITVTAQQTGNTVELTVTAGGKTVESVPGGMTLTVPTANTTPGTVAVLIRPDGTREVVRKSVADNGAVTIPLDGSARVEIVDNSGYFADVPATSWAADAVAFASAHELFNGTAPGQFSPQAPMSRGMLAVVLHNLENNPTQALTGVFADVDNGQWYAEGVSWAAAQGIIGGYGDGRFGPNDNITREQLAVMLWRYAGSPAATDRELHFADAYKASDWAEEALRWTTERGILNGKGGGILDPTGQATRAETAQMLKNFMEKQ